MSKNKMKIIGIIICAILIIIQCLIMIDKGRIDIKAFEKNVSNEMKKIENNQGVGWLEIEGITDKKYPLVEGSSPTNLMFGVGIRKDSILPINKGTTILEMHRETVGYRFDEIRENNIIKLYLVKDKKIYKYKMIDKQIVNNESAKELEDLYEKISLRDKSYLLLSTCYPTKEKSFNPKQRLVIIGELVGVEDNQ